MKNVTWNNFRTFDRDMLDYFYMNQLNENQKQHVSIWWEIGGHGLVWVIKYPVLNIQS